MATAREAAEWMLSQLESSGILYQDIVVYQLQKHFGDDFVYYNANYNLAIGKDVLKEFRRLTEGKAVWERGEKAWRKLGANESYRGRQVD
jgi:hypothetical protein